MTDSVETTPEDITEDLQHEDAQPVESTTKTISVENPTAEEMKQICQNIEVNYNFKVLTKEVKFNFKKSLDKQSGIETIRNAVHLAIPYPSVEGLVAILEAGGNQLALLIEAVEGTVNSAARDLLGESHEFTAATFPVDKLSWEHIANTPKATRRGSGIPKEIWDAFAQDYTEVMPEATGKEIERIANAAKILQNKLAQVKTNEDVLRFLVAQLAIYADHSPNIEDFQECVAFLLSKADTFLNVSPEELLANL